MSGHIRTYTGNYSNSLRRACRGLIITVTNSVPRVNYFSTEFTFRKLSYRSVTRCVPRVN